MEKGLYIIQAINIGPYNTVILKLLKSNMNLQFLTSVYPMRKASKEAYGKDIKGKMFSIGNIFLTKCKVLHMKQSKGYLLSLRMRHSNIDVLYVPTGLKKE